MYKFIFKRFFDLTISIIAILLLSPLLFPVIIGLLFTGENYVFYFQERIGYKNKKFKIWKFATMLKNSSKMKGGLHTVRNDPRITPMGNFLRKSKINEIPQLINVLKGDMSIIGPRPLVDKTFFPYPAHVKEKIYNSKPGLSGIGSIIFRDEEKLLSETKINKSEFYAKFISPYKGELELWYLKNISFKTDLILIFITLYYIFYPKSKLVFKIFKDLPKNI